MSKVLFKILWKHKFSWPFRKPVNPVKLHLPVRELLDQYNKYILSFRITIMLSDIQWILVQ